MWLICQRKDILQLRSRLIYLALITSLKSIIGQIIQIPLFYKKMLKGFQRIDKKTDSRKPITLDVLKQLVQVLPAVCTSRFETQLFKAAFCLAFFGFLRIGEVAFTSSVSDNHVIKISDISFLKILMFV